MSAIRSFSALPDGGVLVVNPSGRWPEQLIHDLSGQEHRVGTASGGADALQKLESGTWKTLLMEPELPDLDPCEVAELARMRYPGLEVRFLNGAHSGGGDARGMPVAISPVPPACNPQEAHAFRERYGSGFESSPEPLPGMVGSSAVMMQVYELARRVAARTTTVLITGATGTGKEVIARALHQLSPRASRPFIVVNCAAIPEALLESELFGYARGAFTGAVQSQAGRISAANLGTLFLDEVGELPLSMQAKLLRFIELKEIQRLGSTEVSRVDARIIAATNSDLARRVGEKQFREDLFYRLAVFCLTLPPLVDRPDDIVPLARYFLAAAAGGSSSRPPLLSPAATRLLMRHTWPGNVRELQLVLERACILADGESEIRPEHISFARSGCDLSVQREMRGIAV